MDSKATNATQNVGFKKRLYIGGGICVGYLLICLILVIYDTAAPSKDSLKVHGIIPRTGRGFIPGIIASPFLHTGWEHLGVNAFGFLVLGAIIFLLYDLKTFGCVTAFVWPVGGFLIWLVSRGGVSICTGTALFSWGWFGYLVTTPCFRRPFSIKALAVAILTGVLYGGISFAIFKGVWEASLCSVASGVLCAVLYWLVWLRLIRPKYFPNGVPKPDMLNNKGSSSRPHERLHEDVNAAETGINGDATFGNSYAPNQYNNSAIMTSSAPPSHDPFGEPGANPYSTQNSMYNKSSAYSTGVPWMDNPNSSSTTTSNTDYNNSSYNNTNSNNPSWLSDNNTTTNNNTSGSGAKVDNSSEMFGQKKGGSNLANEVYNPFG